MPICLRRVHRRLGQCATLEPRCPSVTTHTAQRDQAPPTPERFRDSGHHRLRTRLEGGCSMDYP